MDTSFFIPRDVDKRTYREELAPLLPDKLIDCHVHISLKGHCGPVPPERIKEMWAIEVGIEQSWEHLRQNYRMLYPDRSVTTLAFGNVYREVDIETNNDYILSGACDPTNSASALFVSRPEWSAIRIDEAFDRGFIGIKPYPDLAPQKTLEVSIYDFLPKEHLSVVDEREGLLMLHLPRAGRLGDPDNIRELLEIHEAYPRIKLIVAHIGRSYCLPTAEKGLPHFADAKGIFFDTAANLNRDVFRFALDTVGPDRLLFGSDLPILMMRGVREHVGDRYINYTDGDYSWNTNRKNPEEEARYTYYLYEEIKAILDAVKLVGLDERAIRNIFYSNSARLLGLPEL